LPLNNSFSKLLMYTLYELKTLFMNGRACLVFFHILFLLNLSKAKSQNSNDQKDSIIAPVIVSKIIHSSEKDLGDIVTKFIDRKKKETFKRLDYKKYNFSILPAVGYTLQTGFAALVSGNVGYFSNPGAEEKMSTITTSLTYSQYDQIIFPIYVNIWSKNGKYNLIADNRYISYPSNIFGLGGTTDPNKGHTINFNQIKLHETVLRKITKNVFGGIGFYYDNFYNIKVLDPQTRRTNVFIQKEIGNTEVESGPVFKVVYDSRKNQLNADKGNFLNLTLRQNFEELGSSKEWASLLIDARKYIHFPRNSKNTLALWSYNWLTIAGNPNYLLLPSTGWDDQYNTGRGYIQSRFRGKQMVYFETEYRYAITQNGLIGGVIFANVQNFKGNIRPYDTFLPGYGAGIRIKLNKQSGANLCLDYAFGNGSQGLFVNLGEVF